MPGNGSTCSECFSSGLQCIGQDQANLDTVIRRRKNLRERVASLESFMNIMLEKMKNDEALNGISPSSQSEDATARLADDGRAPLLRLFETGVWTRIDGKQAAPRATFESSPSFTVPSTAPSYAAAVSLESLGIETPTSFPRGKSKKRNSMSGLEKGPSISREVSRSD